MTEGTDQNQHTAAAGNGKFWPSERRLFVRTDSHMRYWCLSPKRQFLMGAGVVALLGWTVFSSASFVVSNIQRKGLEERIVTLENSFQDRMSGVVRERNILREDLAASEQRLLVLTNELAEQQERILSGLESEKEMTLAVETLHEKLRDTVESRNAARRNAAEMENDLNAIQGKLANVEEEEEDWSSTLSGLSDALSKSVAARDQALKSAEGLSDTLTTLQAQNQRAAERRELMFTQIEDAIAESMGALDGVFSKTGINPDSMIDTVRKEYGGAGGPEIPAEGLALDELDPETQRAAKIIANLDEINYRRIVATRIPLSHPVKNAYRMSSSFGTRRDPITGKPRAHHGMDMAAPIGTPIYATADGVVTFSGRQHGYGNVVKIRHSFGYSTVYAHLNKRLVKRGDRVALGDHIADMGNTGRSTGPHLHYEVRVNGRPVNPRKYTEATNNVF